MRLLLAVTILTLLAGPVSAHQCILGGSTATDMQIYNSCKADLATGTAGHEPDSGDTSARIAQLEAENAALKASLKAIRQRLLAILGDL